MEYEYHYIDLADRSLKVAEAEGLGYRMLHDNFDPGWKKGTEPHGTMLFIDVHEPSPIPEPVRDLASEIDDIKIRLNKLEKK